MHKREFGHGNKAMWTQCAIQRNWSCHKVHSISYFLFFFPNGICSEYAHKHGYSVSDELSGHGIGKEFHCHPLIYHHGK